MGCLVTVTLKVWGTGRGVFNVPMIVKEHIVNIVNDTTARKELRGNESRPYVLVQRCRHVLTISKSSHRIVTIPAVQHQMRHSRRARCLRPCSFNRWRWSSRSFRRCSSCRRTRRYWTRVAELCNFNARLLLDSVATIESILVPKTFTPYLLRTPLSYNSIPQFNAV